MWNGRRLKPEQLEIHPVRGDYTFDTRLKMLCGGCREPVLVTSLQGKRLLNDTLCGGCFKRCAKWAQRLGDADKNRDFKVADTKFRKSPRWRTIVAAWKSTNPFNLKPEVPEAPEPQEP